jgi:hypothetical protein
MGLGSVLAGTLLCAGCFNLLEPPVQPRSEKVTVTFTIDGEGGMGRSVLPQMSQFTRIELSAQAQGGGEALEPVPVTDGSAELVLGGGSWDITAHAYTDADPVAPAAAAFSSITNAGGVIEGETRLSLIPVGTGPGILRYAVTLPGGVGLKAGGSRIQVELQGEVRDSRGINASSYSGEFSLAPGIYAADIVLTNGAGKTAAYREAVSILSGLITEITFEPKAGEFLDPGARALLTGQVLFQATANSPQLVFTPGGSDVRRTVGIAAPRGKDPLYFVVKKTTGQTLTVSGEDAERVSKPGTAADGTTPSNTVTVFAVDIPDIVETGGTVSFVIAAGENGRTPIEYAVAITLPRILSLAGAFDTFVENGHYSHRLTYQVGDEFDHETFTVGAFNSDGSNTKETIYTIEGFDTSTPGTKTIRLSKNGIYGTLRDFTHNNNPVSSMEICVLERSNARLVFWNGWADSADYPAYVPPGGYTTPIGRPLVLAPVKWNVPDNAAYEWTVSGGPHNSAPSTTECFSFNPTAQGEYTVTVTATLEGGQTISASTKVTCCPPEGTYRNTAKNSMQGGWSLGYLGGAPSQFNDPKDIRDGGPGFGGLVGSTTFTESLRNGVGYDLRIAGNAFAGWIEPGIIWVAQDANGNGLADDTWYELKGSGDDPNSGVEIMRRYAVTFHSNGAWQDNLGRTGYVPGGPDWYPGTSEWITATNTCIVGYTDWSLVTGYVDTFSVLFDISDAVQADGSPVDLAYIDYVVVRTGMHMYTQLFGEISTEIYGGINAYNAYDPTRRLAGVSDGSGGYTYRLVNNSGYRLTVPVAVQDGVFTDYVIQPGANETVTLSEDTAYFDYSGGNVALTISGNTVTFRDG